MERFDCIIIGAGHAGAEAAYAAACMGTRTALITMSRKSIGQMSCNPAIGGLAKGQIVREIDALGGLMGRAIDATGIQFRTLNRSKGPAVQSPRAQADKYQYAAWIRKALQNTPGLTIIEAKVAGLEVREGHISGVQLADGRAIATRTLVVAAGTFLKGIMHTGADQLAGGRLNEPASISLSNCLRQLGLHMERLKTGTPPRLDASTVDLDHLETQLGDDPPLPFSFLHDRIEQPQLPCWVTRTNEQIHQLLRDNMGRAPLFTGQIKSTGPRYCPSIESKILRFAGRPHHQVYLEPEDAAVTTIYCNGISTSAPRDVQDQMLALMSGTEKARIIHYAYAIEYDYCPSRQLRQNLETKAIGGLFLAGQINGTSGYEEAAGQGLIAGINAVRLIQDRPPLVLGRDQAYIGVLIDDLLTRDIDEPYRMFTSRAEYRLTLRSDNADRRLTPLGRELGLVDDHRWNRFQKKCADLNTLVTYLRETRRAEITLWDQLRQPKNPLPQTLAQDPFVLEQRLNDEVLEAAVVDAKYEGYLAKQQRLITNLKTLERHRLPDSIDYQAVEHLRAEAREKFTRFQPETLAQAARIGGITPADITVLQVHLRKRSNKGPVSTP